MSSLFVASGSNGEPWWITIIKAFVVINLVVDLLYFAVDPRLRIDRAVAAARSAMTATLSSGAASMPRLLGLKGQPQQLAGDVIGHAGTR